MAIFAEHIDQARKNLKFLCVINTTANDHWDWQVTTCFYTAVHLINGYLADVADLHFHSHTDTLNAISTEAPRNKIQVTEECYLAYRKLYNDSIRSRYLSIHKEEKTSDYDTHIAYLTHDRHLQKAVKNLDRVMHYMAAKYGLNFSQMELDCIEMRSKKYTYFQYKQKLTDDVRADQ